MGRASPSHDLGYGRARRGRRPWRPLTRVRLHALRRVQAYLPIVIGIAFVSYGVVLLPGRPIAWATLGVVGVLAAYLWRLR